MQKAYLDAAKAWETNEIANVKKREKIAWIVAGGAGVIAATAVVAVALLTPLKTVEPFVVRVDKNTGQSDVVTLLNERTVTANEAIDKYFLGRYVNYREEFSDATAFPNYEAVSVMSTQAVGKVYFDSINPRNTRAPVNVYGKNGQVDVTVTSVVFMSRKVAQVRFTRREKLRTDSPWVETRWIATVTYEYVNPPTVEKARLVNPVGFRVTDYRLDPETVTP
jgi:type IV secretion system protein VirB8